MIRLYLVQTKYDMGKEITEQGRINLSRLATSDPDLAKTQELVSLLVGKIWKLKTSNKNNILKLLATEFNKKDNVGLSKAYKTYLANLIFQNLNTPNELQDANPDLNLQVLARSRFAKMNI